MTHNIIQPSSRTIFFTISTVYDPSVELNASIMQKQTYFGSILHDMIQVNLFSTVKLVRNQAIVS